MGFPPPAADAQQLSWRDKGMAFGIQPAGCRRSRERCQVPSSAASGSMPKSSNIAISPASGRAMVPESPRLLPPHAPTSSADVGQDTRLTILPEGSHGGMVGNEDGFDELLIECMAKLGVTAGKRTRESLRRALRMWTEGIAREETSSSEATRPKHDGRTRRRSRQRPSLPMEARGRQKESITATSTMGQNPAFQSTCNAGDPPLLAVRGNQLDSSSPKERVCGAMEAAAARWERRYNQQVSATEEALLAKRNAEISLREAERVLRDVRGDAEKAASDAAIAATRAADALKNKDDEASGDGRGKHSERLETMLVRDRLEVDLRQRLAKAEAKVSAAEKEGQELRQALAAAKQNRSLQPVVVTLGQVLTECLASLGMVRGVPDADFHARVSALRDRAEEAGRGFLSVEGLHTAAEGARALDATRNLRAQLHEALLDASRQRARRAEADARLMEKEAGERAGSAAIASDREEVLKAGRMTQEMRARLAVTEAEVERLKESMKEEQKRTAAALEWRGSRAAPMADVRGIFDEGHRDVQAKMKVKAREIRNAVLQLHDEAKARVRESCTEGRMLDGVQ